MRKLIITIALAVVAIAVQAQPKPVQTTQATKYTKYVAIQPQDAQSFLDALNQWERLVIYDPNLDDKSKVAAQVNLRAYIKRLSTTLKLDSVRVDTVAIVKKIK